MKNWLVVANAARARVLEEGDRPGVFAHVADLVHPESRQKGVDLSDDRAGHVVSARAGTGSAAYQPRTDPREREHEQFAREVAEVVNRGVAGGQCVGIVLVASNPFLGHVKAHLSGQAAKLLLRTVAADYTSLAVAELHERLQADRHEPVP